MAQWRLDSDGWGCAMAMNGATTMDGNGRRDGNLMVMDCVVWR
jgi:hypothetical protein